MILVKKSDNRIQTTIVHEVKLNVALKPSAKNSLNQRVTAQLIEKAYCKPRIRPF